MSLKAENLPIVAAVTVAASLTIYAAKRWGSCCPSGKTKEKVAFDDHGGKLVAKVLANHGVKFLFTLSGGHISPILVGAKAHSIRVVDVRHEATAVFAADAVSRLTGIPGVACVTAGPGLTNTITAVKNAQLAQSALILIGGATSDLLKGRGSLQDIDQRALMAPHVKWIGHASSVADIVPLMEQAFAISQSGTPGPVFVEFPIDTLYPEKIAREWFDKDLKKQTTWMGMVVAFFIRRHVNKLFGTGTKFITLHEPSPLNIRSPSHRQISKVLKMLATAERPVIVVGSQAAILPSQNTHQTSDSLQNAVEKLGIPTWLSSMARGLLGLDCIFAFKHNRSVALRKADFVILAGVVCDFRLDYGRGINSRAYVVGVNRDSSELHKNRSPTFGINADPATFLHMLAESLPLGVQARWASWIEELKNLELTRDTQIEEQGNTKITPMNPVRLCKQLDQEIANDSIIVADGGDFVGTASYVVRPRKPLTWLDPGVFGTLGVGAGFALGAKLCKPDSEVWIMWGDGACGYGLSEFDTFVRHNIPVIAVVGNDAAWQQILRGQVEVFNDDVGCALAFTDYHKVVQGFGAEGYKVDKEADVSKVLQLAKEQAKQGRPVLINCLLGKADFRKDSLAF